MDPVTGAMGDESLAMLQKDVKKKVESLSRELESVHVALRKVGEVPRDKLDPQVKLWASEVRDASYDMEDIVDTFLVRVDGRHEPADPHMLVRLGKKIGDINDKLDEVAKRRGRYKIDDIASTSGAKSAIDPRVLNLSKVTELIGIDEPRDEVIEKLSSGEGDNKTKIVSVVGFGGLGKTTLAKTVYDKLKHDFDCEAFVPVGQNPDLTRVFKDILFGLDKVKYDNIHIKTWEERLFIQELQQFLENKRYLIVIDDIWDKNSWELIRCALPDSNCGSRVVATTRISEVVTHAGDVYKLQALSREDSEKLLYTRIADGEGKSLNSPSAESCDKILKKCGGVPLAIITIASLLASKPEHDWPEVYNSISFGHTEGNHAVDNTRMILLFSYYDLPSYLKTCLLYLSVFPKDYLIRKDLLIWKWIAEGFVHEKQGIGLFELGEKYFNELVNRSMIQPVEEEYKGFVYGCRVHNMVLDLVCTLSLEENFVTVLDDHEQHKHPPWSNARRLALQKTKGSEEQNLQLAKMGMQQVRSFIASECSITVVSPRLRVLRVLALEHCDVAEDYKESCLQNIESLHHLRYLGIDSSGISVLPNGVGNLMFLQTLDIMYSSIKEVPDAVGQLTQLLCLRIRTNYKDVHAGWIGKLTSLQELRMNPSKDTAMLFVKELGKLSDLRVLVTHISRPGEDEKSLHRVFLESLCKLHKIQTLKTSYGWNHVDGAMWEEFFVSARHLQSLEILNPYFSRLPRVSASLVPALSYLYMCGEYVQDEDMETLGRFPELRVLELYSLKNALLSIKNTGVGYFRKLRSLDTPGSSVRFDLHVSGCSSSSSLPAPPPPVMMPSLEYLKFRVRVRYLKDANLLDKLGLETIIRIPSLRRVKVEIDCDEAHLADVEEAEAALTRAAAVHPNRPTLEMQREAESFMRRSRRRRILTGDLAS